MSGGLRGFAELRTRLVESEIKPQPKRICPKCGKTVLSRSNPGPLCRPCEFGHIEISDYLERWPRGRKIPAPGYSGRSRTPACEASDGA
jgi:hypothetical protein